MPEQPTAFELANAEILPLLLAKVPEALLPKALEEDGEVSLLRKALAKRDLAKAKLLIERGANVERRADDGADAQMADRLGDEPAVRVV